ncbi:hypothetical protein ARTHRO9V_230220 [Arthrobacter sp. 9V]|nr:hypothetical protein ARTHRO9V_230220 [Arthrobacter sp. 9V]
MFGVSGVTPHANERAGAASRASCHQGGRNHRKEDSVQGAVPRVRHAVSLGLQASAVYGIVRSVATQTTDRTCPVCAVMAPRAGPRTRHTHHCQLRRRTATRPKRATALYAIQRLGH